MEPKQFFFGKEERDDAIAAAEQYDEELFAIVDKRSREPSPRMYVLTRVALNQMMNARMFKRMWIATQMLGKHTK
jgi:hypothetical protein